MAWPTPGTARRPTRSAFSRRASALWDRLPRAATWVLAAVLLVLGGTAAFGLMRTNQASAAAADSSRLAHLFQEAEVRVATQAFYTRQYRLEPSSAVKLRYADAAGAGEAILDRAGESAEAGETKELVRSIRDDHERFSAAAERLIQAVESQDPDSDIIDATEVAPSYFILQNRMDAAATDFRTQADDGLADLRQAQREMLIGTAVMLPLAACCLVLVSRRVHAYQRDLEAEFARSAHQAAHDALTGLPNRTLFARRLGTAVERHRELGSICAVLLIDLDRFKQVNDTLGHHAGDALLTQCAHRMTLALRDSDLVARMGGDEFAVLLPRVTGPEDAESVARRLAALVSQPYELDGAAAEIDCSIGVTMLSDDIDADEVIRRADTAMYKAKSGGGGIVFHARSGAVDDRSDVVVPDRRRVHEAPDEGLISDLRRAIWLEREQFQLHWQPIVSADSGQIISVEALARWERPGHGTLAPDAFIPLAEQAGLIGALTEHLLAVALVQAAALSDRGYPTPVCVNVSAMTLGSETHATVMAALAASGVSPRLLRIEVTESELIRSPAESHEALAMLRREGVEISLDDFGTGYSSLARLASMPLDEVKLDRSVVRATDAVRHTAVLRSAIALSHELGLRVIAEGIEDEETAAMVRRLGCEGAQGFLYARPMPAPDLLTWVVANAERVGTARSAAAATF